MKQKQATHKREKKLPKNNFLIIFLVLILTFTCFLPALKNGFLLNWDDRDYIVVNKSIQQFSWENIRHIFSTYILGNYHPLTLLSFALDHYFFGLNPGAFHAINVFIHLANAFLVFAFCFRLSGNKNIAAITAFLFGIHPMHVESVAWISERKDVLYAFFFLFALVSWLKYQRSGKTRDYIVTLLLFLFSVLSKSAAIVLPVVLLTVDYFLDKKINRKSILLKIPFLMISIFFGIVAIESQQHSGALQVTPDYPLYDRIFLISYTLVFYLQKFILPFHLSAIHFYPLKHENMLPFIYYVSPIVVAVLIWLIAKIRTYRKEIIFGSLFFTGNLLLVIQVIPFGIAITAERYTYIPYIGLMFAGACIYNGILAGSAAGKIHSLAKILFPIISILFCILTWLRVQDWKNGEILFSDVINKYPQGAYGYYALGVYYSYENKYKDAILHYNKALQYHPGDAEAYYNRGLVKTKVKDNTGALADFNESIRLQPNNAIAYNNRAGIKQTHLEDYAGALEDYTLAIRLKPDYYKAYNDRGTVKGKKKDYAGAIRDFNSALAIQPDYSEAVFNRGYAYLLQKKYPEAIVDFSRAIYLDNQYAKAYYNRAECYLNTGERQAACSDLETAFSLGLEKAMELTEKYCK